MKTVIFIASVLLIISPVSLPASATDKDPITGMEFVFVKGGCFRMGDVLGVGDANERPVHEICLEDFYIGRHEVTQGQWKAVMGDNPSRFKDCGDNCPVETVSWGDAQEFISRLNQKSPSDSPFSKGGQGGFRLPTEAEWEYAARSGGKKERWAGTSNESELGNYAWYSKNSTKTYPVGQKKPNGLGIYDMTGNVCEWASDWFADDYYKNSPRDNPKGPVSGKKRILRGGSWAYCADGSRSTNRSESTNPDIRDPNNGFRLVNIK